MREVHGPPGDPDRIGDPGGGVNRLGPAPGGAGRSRPAEPLTCRVGGALPGSDEALAGSAAGIGAPLRLANAVAGSGSLAEGVAVRAWLGALGRSGVFLLAPGRAPLLPGPSLGPAGSGALFIRAGPVLRPPLVSIPPSVVPLLRHVRTPFSMLGSALPSPSPRAARGRPIACEEVQDPLPA
jgi:hypothetical protein